MNEKVKLEARIDKSVYSFQVSPRASQMPAHRLMVIKATVANTNPNLPEASLEDVPPAQWPQTEGNSLSQFHLAGKGMKRGRKPDSDLLQTESIVITPERWHGLKINYRGQGMWFIGWVLA